MIFDIKIKIKCKKREKHCKEIKCKSKETQK